MKKPTTDAKTGSSQHSPGPQLTAAVGRFELVRLGCFIAGCLWLASATGARAQDTTAPAGQTPAATDAGWPPPTAAVQPNAVATPGPPVVSSSTPAEASAPAVPVSAEPPPPPPPPTFQLPPPTAAKHLPKFEPTDTTWRSDETLELSPRFGLPGEVVVSLGVGASSTRWNGSQAYSRAVTFAPSVDYFVARDLSLGFEVTLSYSDQQGYGADGSLDETERSLVSAGPHLGWNIPLGDRWSLFPGLMLGLHHSEQHQQLISGSTISVASSPTGAPAILRTGPWLALSLPLLLQIAPHCLLGFGPTLYHDFARAIAAAGPGAERTSFGAALSVGGFWGGSTSKATTVRYTARRGARFGQRGTTVLTGALQLSAGFSAYSGTGTGSSSVTVAPAAEWFVSEDLSLGGSVSYSTASGTGLQTDGRKVSYTSSTTGLFGRIGGNVPISERVSWYPTADLGVGVRTYDERSGPASNQSGRTLVRIVLSAPILLHVQHYFVGVGPYLSYDVGQTGGSSDNRGTGLGIGTTVGGWL